MNDKLLCTIYSDAANYTDPDAYASDWATSSSLVGAEDVLSLSLVEQLRTLWHIANDPFRDFLALTGLNQTQFSVRFCIPLRTVQGWCGNTRSAPPYLRLMAAELSGLVNLREGN